MIRLLTTLLSTLLLMSGPASAQSLEQSSCPDYLNVEVRRLHSSKSANLCDFYKSGKPLLVVNTASHCGFTSQFSGLETLYRKHKKDGLMVLGFPSNSFKQEEKSEEKTASICYQNYGVTFPMFEHVEVIGSEAHPLFQHLAKASQAPEWNFNKYLLVDDRVLHFGSKITPTDSPLEQEILKTTGSQGASTTRSD